MSFRLKGSFLLLAGLMSAILVRFTPPAMAQDQASSAASEDLPEETSAGPVTTTLEGFAPVRERILEAIGGATQRVWLASDFLTDGEIVAALYLAHYRKLDVRVLLGRAKANAYMSRLNYLKAQNIPVFLKPAHFYEAAVSALLTDHALVLVDGELDFMAKYKKFHVSEASGTEAERFAKSFGDAMQVGLTATAHPYPLVGRQRHYSRGRPYRAAPVPESADEAGSYNYDRSGHRDHREAGVTKKLPRQPKWEQLDRERERSRSDAAAPEQEASPR